MKKCIFIITFCIIFTISTPLLVTFSFAAEYHVTVSGNDSSGNGSLLKPWRTPEYGAQQLAAGDTLFIHKGTYYINGTSHQLPTIRPIHSGTASNRITITAYGDDEVILDGGKGPTDAIIGVLNMNYITISALKVKGLVIFWSTTGSILEYCDIWEGGDNYVANYNFGNVLYIENTHDCIIRNNWLHDNVIAQDRSHSPLVHQYDSWNLVIEHNEFYNSKSSALVLKDNPETVYVRYNYFHDNYHSGVWSANQDDGHNVYVYNNIFYRNGNASDEFAGGVHMTIEVSPVYIYNNTFVKNRYADIHTWATNAVKWYAFNNLHYNSEKFISARYNPTIAQSCRYLDYNNYYGSGTFADKSVFVNSLLAWKTHLDSTNVSTYEDHSLSSDPGFVNSDGTKAEDFKRISYPKNGRGGNYPAVMGAYVTGSETIGTGASLSGTNIPSPPTNLKVISN